MLFKATRLDEILGKEGPKNEAHGLLEVGRIGKLAEETEKTEKPRKREEEPQGGWCLDVQERHCFRQQDVTVYVEGAERSHEMRTEIELLGLAISKSIGDLD
jgi:hypothetical protein